MLFMAKVKTIILYSGEEIPTLYHLESAICHKNSTSLVQYTPGRIPAPLAAERRFLSENNCQVASAASKKSTVRAVPAME